MANIKHYFDGISSFRNLTLIVEDEDLNKYGYHSLFEFFEHVSALKCSKITICAKKVYILETTYFCNTPHSSMKIIETSPMFNDNGRRTEYYKRLL